MYYFSTYLFYLDKILDFFDSTTTYVHKNKPTDDVFSFLQYSNDPNCRGQMFLKKNGAAVSTGSTSKDDAFQGIFGTAILNLVAGDQVSPTNKRKDVWSQPKPSEKLRRLTPSFGCILVERLKFFLFRNKTFLFFKIGS